MFVNHVLNDCDTKEVVFPYPKKGELVATPQVWKEVKKGVECYVVLTHMIGQEEEQTKEIPSVEECLDVFDKPLAAQNFNQNSISSFKTT